MSEQESAPNIRSAMDVIELLHAGAFTLIETSGELLLRYLVSWCEYHDWFNTLDALYVAYKCTNGEDWLLIVYDDLSKKHISVYLYTSIRPTIIYYADIKRVDIEDIIRGE